MLHRAVRAVRSCACQAQLTGRARVPPRIARSLEISSKAVHAANRWSKEEIGHEIW
jgi:hypothetical protein